jgi:hypothetical protein
VNCHLCKANVVANVPSHKVHYNYLPAICLTREESNTQVLPNLSMYNVTLTPMLRDEIIASQNNDEGMAHIKGRMQEGDLEGQLFQRGCERDLMV